MPTGPTRARGLKPTALQSSCAYCSASSPCSLSQYTTTTVKYAFRVQWRRSCVWFLTWRASRSLCNLRLPRKDLPLLISPRDSPASARSESTLHVIMCRAPIPSNTFPREFPTRAPFPSRVKASDPLRKHHANSRDSVVRPTPRRTPIAAEVPRPSKRQQACWDPFPVASPGCGPCAPPRLANGKWASLKQTASGGFGLAFAGFSPAERPGLGPL
jgi:hypothetical protein